MSRSQGLVSLEVRVEARRHTECAFVVAVDAKVPGVGCCKRRLLRSLPQNSSSHSAYVRYMVRVGVVLYSSLRPPEIAVAV
jgi:hypothetical protein